MTFATLTWIEPTIFCQELLHVMRSELGDLEETKVLVAQQYTYINSERTAEKVGTFQTLPNSDLIEFVFPNSVDWTKFSHDWFEKVSSLLVHLFWTIHP